jgi:hypothetical protein
VDLPPELDTGEPARRGRVAALLVAGALGVALVGALVSIGVARGGGTGSAGAADDAPTLLEVRCDGGATSLSQDVVAARPDGVHVTVSGRFHALAFGDGSTWFQPSEQDLVGGVALAPGRWHVSCVPDADVSVDPVADGATFQVVDPGGYWRDATPDCERFGSCLLLAEELPAVEASELPSAIVTHVPGVELSDVVEYAGYPEPSFTGMGVDSRTYRIVRNGKAIGILRVHPLEDGRWGWYASACHGSSLREEIVADLTD